MICHSFVAAENRCMRTTDWGSAGGALLGIQVAEAVETVGKVVTRGETLARKLLLTAGAQEAVLVPRLVVVGHTSGGDGLGRNHEHIFQDAFLRSSVGSHPIFSLCKIVYQNAYFRFWSATHSIIIAAWSYSQNSQLWMFIIPWEVTNLNET